MAPSGERQRRFAAHLRDAFAENAKSHTPEELQAAELALHTPHEARQPSLFTCTDNRGVAPSGQPGPAGFGARDLRNPD